MTNALVMTIFTLFIIQMIKFTTMRAALNSLSRKLICAFSVNQQFQTNKSESEFRQAKLTKYGQILGNIVCHVESDTFRSNFLLKKYLHKHGWCCLHMWMLDYRSRFLNCSWSELPMALLFRWQLKYLMNNHNYAQVSNYTDRADREIYYELCRIQNVVYWSLDDYFVYNFRQKPLSQIICEDMGLYIQQKEVSELQTTLKEENIVKIEKYIESNMKQMQKMPLQQLTKGQFTWLL